MIANQDSNTHLKTAPVIVLFIAFLSVSSTFAQLPDVRGLYTGCENFLELQLPLGSTAEGLSIKAINGTARLTEESKIEVVPNSMSSVVLQLMRGGEMVDQKGYRILAIPKPRISLHNEAGQNLQSKRMVNTVEAKYIEVLVSAEPNFSLQAPNDSKYRIVKGRYRISGQSPKTFSGSEIKSSSVPIGPIAITVDELVREKHDGTTEAVKLGSRFLVINVNN